MVARSAGSTGTAPLCATRYRCIAGTSLLATGGCQASSSSSAPHQPNQVRNRQSYQCGSNTPAQSPAVPPIHVEGDGRSVNRQLPSHSADARSTGGGAGC